MKKAGLLLLFVLLLAAVSTVIMAQDATAEPTAEATAEATQNADESNQTNAGQSGVVTRVRFANLSPDAPVFVVYADGQPTNVQLLEYPAISGWVEFAGSPTFALVPRGSAQSQALLGGTFTLDNTSGDWTTIAIVGSQNDGSLSAVAFNENVTNIPAGCARVTVFHAIEGAPSVDITDDQGNTWVSGLGFPGSSAGGSATSSAPGCTGQGAEATAEAGTTGSQASQGNQASTMSGTGALQCVALVMSSSQASSNNQGAEATAEAGMAGSQGAEATAEATSAANATTGNDSQQGSGMFTGSTSGNCGYTFDVPAGTVNLQVVPSGTTGNALLNLSDAPFSADTYYFIAAIGTPDNPQTFVWSFSGSPVSNLLTNEQANTAGEATPEATMETTPEATPGM